MAERDATIVSRFGDSWKRRRLGELDRWSGSPHRLLALILLLDQFPRHAWRGRALRLFPRSESPARSPRWAADRRGRGADSGQRLFLYLPLQHAESTGNAGRIASAAYRRLLADAPAGAS